VESIHGEFKNLLFLKDLYNRNYKSQRKEIKEYSRRLKDLPCS
jgi:hypothetical protein